jgi:membrane associated rhomboid family serine protease
MEEHPRNEPAINAPGIVIAMLAVLVAIHAGRGFLDAEADQQVLLYLALLPVRIGPIGAELPGGFSVGLSSLATHALLHGDWMHLLVNGAWFLAFGSLIARRTSVLGFLVLFIVCTVAGGLAYIAVNGLSQTIVIGASGAVSGLMGAGFRLIFTAFEFGGIAILQRHPDLVPRMPLGYALRDRRTMVATGIWVLVNLALGLFGPALIGADGIAWEAHLGGFLAGFLLFGMFDRGRAAR